MFMVRSSIQMLEVRWHKAEHFACSWLGFAHRGGVSIIFLFLFCVFCTHGLCVNHFPMSVCLLHTRVVCQQMCTHGLSYSMICFNTFAKHSTCKYQLSIHILIHVCVWMDLSMQALIDYLLYSRMRITCIHI